MGQEINVFEQLSHGGISIITILALSVLAVAVAIERLRHCREVLVVPPKLAEEARRLWRAGDFAALMRLPEQQPSTFARVIATMAEHRDAGREAVSSAAGDLASLELRRHQQRAYPLAVVATVAPIIGLLGTVIGMIEAFHVIAATGSVGDPSLLAGGISKALVNTATGLAVALPSLCLHHFFKNRLAHISMTLEAESNALLRSWFLQKEGRHAD